MRAGTKFEPRPRRSSLALVFKQQESPLLSFEVRLKSLPACHSLYRILLYPQNNRASGSYTVHCGRSGSYVCTCTCTCYMHTGHAHTTVRMACACHVTRPHRIWNLRHVPLMGPRGTQGKSISDCVSGTGCLRCHRIIGESRERSPPVSRLRTARRGHNTCHNSQHTQHLATT